MKRKIGKVFGVCLLVLLTNSFSPINSSAHTQLPVADGIDLGGNQDEISACFWMSSYSYSTTEFKIGCYLNSGNSFSVNRRNNPYMNATHAKKANNDPNVYRVTYQAIYADSGNVRIGVPFLGPIDDVEVKFNINETDDFIFYIAGDGTNSYSASGKLYYGGY